ncbi:hypothetical protein HY572_04650 [Candidatus Micrarchaeota archaeon]|nr:hypothetical protein [Candidatus Micrarchaeota archaeon]
MKRFLFWLVLAGLAAGYVGTSASFQAELAVVDGSNPINASSASYNVYGTLGTLSQDANGSVLFVDPGFGFTQATRSPPQSSTLVAPVTTACCGPYTFTVRWTDLTGLGVDRVVFESSLGNQTAALTSGTASDGTWSNSFSAGAGAVTYRWYAVNRDGLWNFTGQQTFTVTPAAAGTGSTATPAPATAPAATSSPPSLPPFSGSSQTPTPVPPEAKNFGDSRFGSSQVFVDFKPQSTQFTYSFTANAQGVYSVQQHIPGIDVSDVDAGLVSFSPQPSKIQQGSVIATWDVSLAEGQEFDVTVTVAKALSKSILDQLEPPVVKSTSAPVSGSQPVEEQTPTPEEPAAAPAAAADYTLWYVVGALILLGVVYFAFMGKKPKKGL